MQRGTALWKDIGIGHDAGFDRIYVPNLFPYRLQDLETLLEVLLRLGRFDTLEIQQRSVERRVHKEESKLSGVCHRRDVAELFDAFHDGRHDLVQAFGGKSCRCSYVLWKKLRDPFLLLFKRELFHVFAVDPVEFFDIELRA